MSTAWAERTTTPRYTVILTIAAVVPFVAATAQAFGLIGSDTEFGRKVTCHYGAIMLGFIGGIHWGFAMIGYGALTTDDKEAVFGAAAATFAVASAGLALYLPTTPGLIVLAIAFLLHLGYDIFAAYQGMSPRWQTRLRTWFVIAVVISLVICAMVPETPA